MTQNPYQYRGYDIVPMWQWSSWCTGIYATRPDLPIMSQSTLPAAGARNWVRDICLLLDHARCYVLRTGDLESSIAAVKEVLWPMNGRFFGIGVSDG